MGFSKLKERPAGAQSMLPTTTRRPALPATAFFQIPGNRLIELGAQVEI